jgi:hypothetical protein
MPYLRIVDVPRAEFVPKTIDDVARTAFSENVPDRPFHLSRTDDCPVVRAKSIGKNGRFKRTMAQIE